MTRIDNVSSPQDRDALKKEIRHEIRAEERRKKLRSCGGCLLLVLIAAAVPVGLVAMFLAKTGFVEVPLLSRALYKPSAPIHDVYPFAGETADQVLAVLPNKMKYDPVSAQISLPVTEQEFTTVMQHAATLQSSKLPFPVSRMQIVVEPDSVEIYAVSQQHGRDATVRMRFVPQVRGGEIVILSPSALLGSQAIPAVLVEPFFNYFSKSLMGQMRSQLDAVGRLTDIKLSQGVMTFVFFRQ